MRKLVVGLLGFIVLLQAITAPASALVTGACSLSQFALIHNPDCVNGYGDLEDSSGLTEEEVRTDAAVRASQLQKDNAFLTETFADFSDKIRGLPIADSKKIIVRNLNDGNSKIEAKSKATDSVRDIYSAQQHTVYSQQTVSAEESYELYKFVNSSSVDVGKVYPDLTDDYIMVRGEATKTLINGSEIDVTVIGRAEPSVNDGKDWKLNYKYTYYNGTTEVNWTSVDGSVKTSSSDGVRDLNVVGPEGNQTYLALNSGRFVTSVDRIRDNYRADRDATRTIADDLFNKYDPGEITVPEIQGILERVKDAPESSEGDAYSFALAERLGTSTNATQTFVVEYNNENITGQLYASNYTGTLSVGQTYNGTEQRAYIVNTQGTLQILDGQYTILDIIDSETGESRNQTTVEDTDIETRNTTDIQEQFKEFNERLDRLDDKSSDEPRIALPEIDNVEDFTNSLQNIAVLAAIIFVVVIIFVVLINLFTAF